MITLSIENSAVQALQRLAVSDVPTVIAMATQHLSECGSKVKPRYKPHSYISLQFFGLIFAVH